MRNWRAVVGLLALMTVLALTVVPVPAQDRAIRAIMPTAAPTAQDGNDAEVYHGVISVEGKEIPLPEGDWHVAGHAVTLTNQTPPRHTVVSVALVRMQGLVVDAAVLVQTNKLDTEADWGKATACDRTDLYFARIRYSSDHDGSCAYAAYVDPGTRFDANVDPAWKQVLLRGAGMGWRFPAHWLEAAYRINDPRDAVQIRYLFDPAGSNGGGVNAAMVKSLVAWTEASWYSVGSGFRNRLGPEPTLPDWRLANEASAKVLQHVGEEQGNEAEHIGAKMITYRLFGTMTDMSVNYLWLGSLPSAGGLAIVSAMASSALYFFHELAWRRFEQPESQVGDLPGVGVEVPGPGSS